MRRFAMLITLSVASCTAAGTARQAIPGMESWHFASGKTPTRAEYNAVVASCESGAIASTRGKPLTACLVELGLRKSE
jgi:hypothetical protein